MDKPPHDDGGPAFPFDREITTASENGPIKTDVVAHQGISFADLAAALFMPCFQDDGHFGERARLAYALADHLIKYKREREKAVAEYWRNQAQKVQAMEEQGAKERAATATQPSDG